MDWKLVLFVLLCGVAIVATYYVGYSLIFMYLFLCRARRTRGQGRVAEKLFRPIATSVDEFRGQIHPDRLIVIDQRILRNTVLMVPLTGTVLVLLGWLAAMAFRFLIS